MKMLPRNDNPKLLYHDSLMDCVGEYLADRHWERIVYFYRMIFKEEPYYILMSYGFIGLLVYNRQTVLDYILANPNRYFFDPDNELQTLDRYLPDITNTNCTHLEVSDLYDFLKLYFECCVQVEMYELPPVFGKQASRFNVHHFAHYFQNKIKNEYEKNRQPAS